jgi:SAP domain-containing new25
MSRPLLNQSLPAQEFLAWYWLKVELQAYCRRCGLPVSGDKGALMRRTHRHLQGRKALPATRGIKRQPPPRVLHLGLRIEPGWTLSRSLRAFFQRHRGAGFRFNQALRDLFREPRGRTLGEALELHAQTYRHPAGPSTACQFNKHIREFTHAHPRSTRCDALAAWREKRATRGALAFFRDSHR